MNIKMISPVETVHPQSCNCWVDSLMKVITYMHKKRDFCEFQERPQGLHLP